MREKDEGERKVRETRPGKCQHYIMPTLQSGVLFLVSALSIIEHYYD
jgi:hypothetical protein